MHCQPLLIIIIIIGVVSDMRVIAVISDMRVVVVVTDMRVVLVYSDTRVVGGLNSIFTSNIFSLKLYILCKYIFFNII